MIAWLERHKHHPGGIAGRIVVRFTLDRRGRLLASSIVARESEKRLERIALSQLQEASPFPRPPSDAAWRTRSFVVRLDYRSSQAR
ncbi:energy transducer TonB [Brevundimonas vesicularis]|uniref:energy transducer TonB n=1 Tax=Brevundimonas vesicularis TaxID=41276 RepID=UPI0038D379D7